MRMKCDICRQNHPCGVNVGPCIIEFDMLDASMLPENCPFDIDKEPDWQDAPLNAVVAADSASPNTQMAAALDVCKRLCEAAMVTENGFICPNSFEDVVRRAYRVVKAAPKCQPALRHL
jgi:hypothetical protein